MVYGQNGRRGITSVVASNVSLSNFWVIDCQLEGINGAGAYFSSGEFNLSNMVFAFNDIDYGGSGAGLYGSSINITITNSTFSLNRSTDSGYGAGIYLENSSGVIQNSTIANNEIGSSPGLGAGIAIISPDGGTLVSIQNSIISDNELYLGYGYSDVYYATNTEEIPVASNGYNIIGYIEEPIFINTGDQANTDPLLFDFNRSLGVHQLAASSPAIDAGSPATPGSGGTACESADQLGRSRPIDGDDNVTALCDIGAYETEVPLNVIITKNPLFQFAEISSTYGSPLSVEVQDEYRNRVEGVEVTFIAPETGASAIFSSTGTNVVTAITDENGKANSGELIANDVTGEFNVIVTIPESNEPASFPLENYIPGPHTIESISGENQITTLSNAFLEPLKVLVRNQVGLPVAGVEVTFSAPFSGASGTFADTGTNVTTAITNVDGTAESTLITANNFVGTFAVQASVADFTLTTQFSLEIVNTPPVVEILSPADRSTFDFNVPIWLNGNAADAEDGDISHLITWSSSVDGVIGTGESITFYNATPGSYVITAEATDSAGETAQATVRVMVFENVPPVPILFSPEFPEGAVGIWHKSVAMFGDKNGSSDFLTLQVHMDAGPGNPNGLNVQYLVDTNELYLQEADSENWVGPCTPGDVGTLSNGYVEINCKLTTPYYLAEHFMKLRILARWIQPIEAPIEMDVLLRATDIYDNDSGFKSKGTWTLLPE